MNIFANLSPMAFSKKFFLDLKTARFHENAVERPPNFCKIIAPKNEILIPGDSFPMMQAFALTFLSRLLQVIVLRATVALTIAM